MSLWSPPLRVILHRNTDFFSYSKGGRELKDMKQKQPQKSLPYTALTKEKNKENDIVKRSVSGGGVLILSY